ncbi:MAG: hypothetical protein KIS61_21260 [Candidatus Eremiobacteraeota bacterium]|nr:hypothetical protein [Candidatus Eremiobacteraeota bacterium]
MAEGLSLRSEPKSILSTTPNFDDLPQETNTEFPLPQAPALPAGAPPVGATPAAAAAPPSTLQYRAEALTKPNHFFLFSDNWESLSETPAGRSVLCSHTHTSNGSVSYRVLAWHLNQTGAPLHFGLVLENRGTSPIRVKALKAIEDFNNGNYFASGRSIAAAALAGSLATRGEFNVQTNSKGVISEAIIASNVNRHFFSLLEFELVSASTLDYVLRVVADPSDLLKRDGPPVIPEPSNLGPWRGHARGVWPYDAVQISLENPLDVGTGLPTSLLLTEHRQAPTVNPDVKLFAANLSVADGESRANRGLFGVDLFLKLDLANSTNSPKKVSVTMQTPFADGINGYTGAFRFDGKTQLIEPSPGKTHLGKANPRSQHLFDITVPAKTFTNSPFDARIRLHHGGTSSLPVQLILS